MAAAREGGYTLGSIPEFRVVTAVPQNDFRNWGLNLPEVRDVWRRDGGEGVRVAVIDSGIDSDHPDLAGACVAARDFTGGQGGDTIGHGTHIAGIIAARANGIGVVGVAPRASLIDARVMDRIDRPPSSERIAAAIDWATDMQARVVSLSLGRPEPDPLVHDAIRRAVDRGVLVVCSAGNFGPKNDSILYPAAYPEALAVGYVGIYPTGIQVGPRSSRGRQLDLVAPGEGVLSTFPRGRWAYSSGTSMAAPFVAGVAALIIAKRRRRREPELNAEVLRRLITRSARDLYARGHDPYSGWGLINPRAAINFPGQ